mgnify:CR=1 FL=1
MFNSQKFYLTLENFSETIQNIDVALSKEKITRKESMNALLLLEENFMRLVNIGKAESVNVKISQRFGDLTLTLESTGEEYNPLISATDFDEDDEDYFRTIILKSNAEKMHYTRKGNKNLVFIQIHENTNKQLNYTLFGMVAGIVFGLILKFVASSEIISIFTETIGGSVNTMFMNALNMMIAPVVFFSIISGITGLTNSASIGRIGGKLIGLYSITTIIAICVGLTLAHFAFSSGVPQVGIVDGTASTEKLSLLSAIVNIIPKDLVTPIINRGLLQIIFVAVIFGLCINKLGDKVRMLNDFAKEANDFCLTLITAIAAFIPIVVFFAMAGLVINLGMDSIILLVKLLICYSIGNLLMICTYSLMLLMFGKISPIPLLKKLPSFVAVPFATSSSNVTMPFTMKFCTEKIGISPKISSFSIPIGATVNMDGTAIFYSTTCIMLLKMYGVEIDSAAIFTLLLAIFTVSVGTPGIPGGAVVLMAAIVGMFGVPAEAVAIVFGISPIEDRINTTTNVVGDIGASAILAKTENLLDTSIYYKM